MTAPLPIDENERLKALLDYEILDTDAEQSFDDLTLLASQICDTPQASISLIDGTRQWFKSKVGIAATETPRDIAFCAHTILENDVLEIADAKADERFATNPLVTGARHVRFYAGSPLVTSTGHALGALCVIDQVPRHLTEQQKASLQLLSRQVVAQFELRRSLKAKSLSEQQLRESEISYRRLFEAAKDGILILEVDTGRITDVNPFLFELLGFSREEMIGKTVGELSPFKDVVSNQTMLERLQQDKYIRYEDLPLETRDGRHIAVEFVCNVYQAGPKQVIQCNIRDITERKRSEQQMVLLNTCISNLNDIVMVTEAGPLDEPGPRIVFVNEAFERITGYTSAEAIGRSPRFLQGEKTDPKIMSEIHQALLREEPIRREIINYGKDGTEYLLDIDIVPISNSAGKCTHFAAVERDITEQKRAETAQMQLAAIVESSDDAILGKDLNSIVTSWNKGANKLFGYTGREMVGTSVMRLIPPERQEEENQIMSAIKQGESVEHFETVRQAKDGRLIDVSVTASPINDAEGNVVGVSKVVHDITEQHRMEEELRESEHKFRAIFEDANDAIYILKNGLFTDCNTKALEYFGVTREELLGKFATHFSPVLQPDGRDSREKATEIIQSTLTGRAHFFEWTNRRPDGTPISSDVSLSRFTVGEEIYLQAIARDITQRKQSEERLAEQAALLDKTRDAILVGDLKGKILFWNKGAERMYGWTSEEAVGQNISGLLYSNSMRFKEVNRLTVSQGEWQGELQHIKKDRSEITIEARWTLICDNQGKPKSVLTINTDISEKKKIESQFMRAQRMESIGTLAGGIAHDLNNILAPILMSIELLKSTSSADRDTQMILQTIEVSAKRGADIVRQVLSFARGMEGERVEIQPKHLLSDLESIIQGTFPKDIRLQFIVPNETWTIMGDPTQVHQILLNLCVNARDAMPNGGSLAVEVKNCLADDQNPVLNTQIKAGRYVHISVTDSGTGMAPDVANKIFEPFFTTKDMNKGTGLGLSTVMAIVKSHEGVINVYSEPGKGTVFNVYLPAMELSSSVKKEQSEEESLPRGNGETILVVDDEASILIITSQTLEAYGYRVLTATDGAEAVAIYAQHRHEIAAVLTDMMMPIMDGPATIRALTKIDPEVKIIGASGLNANAEVAKASGNGVKHFLTKPYTAGTLLKTMRAILT